MTAPAVPSTATFDSIDLDAERDVRAAARGVTQTEFPIRLGGEVVAYIPTELPLDVLAPLRELDDEITLLLRSVMTAMNQGREAQERWDATSLIVDVLAANPKLPSTIVDVIISMAKALLDNEAHPDLGYEKFVSKRPTKDDMSVLAKRLLAFYGFTLGELQPSSESSTGAGETDGETSTLTSSTTTDSTSEVSGDAPVAPGSSERVAS